MSTVTSAVKVAAHGKLPLAGGRAVSLLVLPQPAGKRGDRHHRRISHDREGFLVCPDKEPFAIMKGCPERWDRRETEGGCVYMYGRGGGRPHAGRCPRADQSRIVASITRWRGWLTFSHLGSSHFPRLSIRGDGRRERSDPWRTCRRQVARDVPLAAPRAF